MTQMDANYTYLPWVRQGLISAVTAESGQDARIELKVSADISGGYGSPTNPISIMLLGPGDVTGIDTRQVIRTDPPNLTTDFEPNYFPLIEFDRPDFPWLFTPEVPEVPDDKNQLKPWICLIAVEKRDGVELKYQEGQPLPVLSIMREAHKELPDLSEAWAWAHAQVGSVSDEDETDLQNALKSQPERTLSRLMCPRRLKPKTAYYVCVVPTYLGGLQAGLGEIVNSAKVKDHAWNLKINPPSDIRLPVYYHWEFATGAQGDFEALVWQLERRQFTFKDVGTRKLDISHTDYGLPASDPVDLEGVLAPQPTPDDDLMVGPSKNYEMILQALLNGTDKQSALVLPPPIYGRWHAAQRTIPDMIDPSLTRDRAWLRAINLDPRYRVAAGLGAQVVRDQQEHLMASAWDQVGDIEQANQILRQAQLARAASISIHQDRLAQLDATSFLLVTGPVQPRVSYSADKTGQELTALGQVKVSALPKAATSAQFRRMLRPRGVIARRFGIVGSEKRTQLIDNLNQCQINPAPLRWPTPSGMVTMESLLARSPCNISHTSLAQNLLEKWPPARLIELIDHVLLTFASGESEIAGLAGQTRGRLKQVNKDLIKARRQLEAFVSQAGESGGANIKLVVSYYRPALALIAHARWLVARLGSGGSSIVADISHVMDELPTEDELRMILFGLIAIMLQQSVEPCDDKPLKLKSPLDIEELKELVWKKIAPHITITARVGTLIQAPGWKADDLDTILAAPDFSTPMYKALVETSQDWLLPGLERVPPNTLTLLESNPRFIEAFMVGLNHEMSRELLWRGYPTDQRGTYFRQFWDPSGRFSTPKDDNERKDNLEAGKDMPPIHEWKDKQLGVSFGNPSSAMGTTSAQPAAAQTVLLVRGDLLRRYPRAMIYAAKAEWSVNSGKKEPPRKLTDEKNHPVFRGELAPDINFLGFDLDPSEAKGTDEPSDDPSDDGAGWFIVIQQQPTEPRYGLDETKASSDFKKWTWRDLAWPHVNLTDTGYIELEAGLKTDDFPSSAQKGPEGQTWKWTPASADSAQIACITQQGPACVAIHASDLL